MLVVGSKKKPFLACVCSPIPVLNGLFHSPLLCWFLMSSWLCPLWGMSSISGQGGTRHKKLCWSILQFFISFTWNKRSMTFLNGRATSFYGHWVIWRSTTSLHSSGITCLLSNILSPTVHSHTDQINNKFSMITNNDKIINFNGIFLSFAIFRTGLRLVVLCVGNLCPNVSFVPPSCIMCAISQATLLQPNRRLTCPPHSGWAWWSVWSQRHHWMCWWMAGCTRLLASAWGCIYGNRTDSDSP